MQWSFKVSRTIALTVCIIASALFTEVALANDMKSGASFSQMVLKLPEGTKFQYEWSKKDNSLYMNFPGIDPSALDAFNDYDESLIRRVLIKDLGDKGTDVRIVFRDADVEGVVSTFEQPNRIVIDLFDKSFREQKDAITGIPVSSVGGAQSSDDSLVRLATDKPAAAIVPSPSKRRLIQQMAPIASSPNELGTIISKLEPGLGKAWASFPPYVYRTQIAPGESRATNNEMTRLQANALTTSGAMADYASKLYDLGHETRALAAYQQVLQREPDVFEKNASHLWKLAESHLSAGNLTLAEGYYQTLIEKHPNHLMSRFAQVRKLDVRAIRAIGNNEEQKLSQLAEQVITIPTRESAELLAMIAMRNAWWSDTDVDQKSRSALANCSEETELTLNKILPKIDNPKTAYLASALIAKRLSSAQTNWQKGYAEWLGKFFARYRHEKDPMTLELSEATRKKIQEQFRQLFEGNQNAEVVALYEQLPREMKSITKNPIVSWQVAESYRALGQKDAALDFYQKTVNTADAKITKFKAEFWLASISAEQASDLKARRSNPTKAATLNSRARKSDQQMEKTWETLSADERNALLTALGGEFRNVTASDLALRTPAKLVLEQYKMALTDNPPKLDATPGTDSSDWVGNFSPSSATVRLLDDLGRKFAELGMPNERRDAMTLMRFIKPNQLEQDQLAAKLWAAEMTKLAEDHRKADEFLEAGKIYTQIGEVTSLENSRAESLYKGGLLLFRAGRKDDAIKALEKAKSDPNNLFYSNLATERLSQISH